MCKKISNVTSNVTSNTAVEEQQKSTYLGRVWTWLKNDFVGSLVNTIVKIYGCIIHKETTEDKIQTICISSSSTDVTETRSSLDYNDDLSCRQFSPTSSICELPAVPSSI